MRQIQSIRGFFNKFSLLAWLLLLGIVWLIAATLLWWHIVYTDPKNTFEAMIKNNFSTSGFTRATNTNQQGLSANEKAQLQLGKDTAIHTRTTLKQQGDTVVTESISTQDKEYVRYLKIETKSKDANGKSIDFSKAVNKWASSPNNGSSQAVAQAILGIVPMGNVPANQRDEIVNSVIKNKVFVVNYGKVKKETVDGRERYTYDVQLMPQPYIAMLKQYGQAIGLNAQVSNLNPSDYANAQPTTLKLSVDVASRHVTSITYGGSAERTENYSGYGIVKDLNLPTKTISSTELQKQLSGQ